MTRLNNSIRAFCGASILALLSACGSDGETLVIDVPPAPEVPPPQPYQEILDQGINRYLGEYSPMSSTDNEGTVTHEFGSGDGPICLDGSNYKMATHDTGAAELMIFLEGGGGCWSDLCVASESANTDVPLFGIRDTGADGNPVKGWNTAYLPYCDGSLFAGDKDNDYDGDGELEYQRGLKNLSAALDVTVNQFPAPSRIVLTGNSGGGYGTLFALPLVRSLYPDTPIDVINDSGVGIGTPGSGDFFDGRIADWNVGAFFPESICPDCYASGHITEYINWQMQEDDNFHLSMISSKQDQTIAVFFLRMAADVFESELLNEMAALEEANPERFRSFIVNGNDHTYLQRDFTATADGVVLSEWLGAMLDKTAEWVSVLDP